MGTRMKYRHAIWSFLLILIIVLTMSEPRTVSAGETLPYDTYTYDYYGDARYTPAAYVPQAAIGGEGWECGPMKNPMDLTVAEDGTIYIADTDNNRIIILDQLLHYEGVITEYDYQGTRTAFQSPGGVTTAGELLYIADTGNRRVIALNEKLETVKIIENPQSDVLGEGYLFEPMKVSVDYAGRAYIIAKNTYQGILSFSAQGSFRGFTGKIEVSLSPYEKIWRKLTTKAQRSKQQLYIPTEFTGMEIDEDGFIYATNIDSKGIQSIRRLNPKGEDVIQKSAKERLSGDLNWRFMGDYSGPSRIVDVVIRKQRIYSAVDAQRGRIFTYDHEGNLLYIFGGIGTQTGTFTKPVAIEALGDDILVLDAAKNCIMVFNATEYGDCINKAVGFRYDGNETESVAYWNKVLELDNNNELANLGLGKAYLASGDNKKAMSSFEKAKNRHYYSISYKRYRNELLKNNLKFVFTAAVVISLGYLLIRKERKIRRVRYEKKG